MSLGRVSFETVGGGGQARPSSSAVCRRVVAIGVSPKGDAATIYRVANDTAIKNYLDTGKLAEYCALMGSDIVYAVPLDPSVVGHVSAVTHTGTGDGAIALSLAPHCLVEILITVAGALGTMKYKWRLRGTGTWSAAITSTASPDPNVFRVPGTYCKLSFAAGTYVLNSTYTISTAGVITRGGSAINTVTQASSPIDTYDVVATVVKAGALGAAVLRVSMDGGNTSLPDLAIPSGGVIVLPGTGIVLTCTVTTLNFVVDDTYTFVAHDPGYSSGDLDDALDAIRADATLAGALVHVIATPGTAAGAISQAASLDAALTDAREDDGLDWQGLCECPVVDDIIDSGSAALLDTADTDSVIRAARAGQDLKYTALAAAQHRMTSSLTRQKLKRPFGWALAYRFTRTNPRDDISKRADGPLAIFDIGRDELFNQNLDDVQINVAQSLRSRSGVFLAITSGGFGFKNLTTDADFQDAGGVRALNIGVRRLREVADTMIGLRLDTNADGTIEEKERKKLSARLDNELKRALGLKAGGDFVEAQVSLAEAEVLATSQLGESPHRLEISYVIQKLGFVSDVAGVGRFSGTIAVEG